MDRTRERDLQSRMPPCTAHTLGEMRWRKGRGEKTDMGTEGCLHVGARGGVREAEGGAKRRDSWAGP